MTKSPTSGSTERALGLDPTVAMGLAVAVVFFLASGILAFLNLQAVREGNLKIVQSYDVIVALDGLLSSAQDAETGQRGFILSDNDRYLEPYNTALAAIPAKLNAIAQLTRDNPAQERTLATLKIHVDAKLAELAQTIDLRRTQGLDAALAVVNSDRGKIEMDAIRAQLGAMAQEEASLRSRRLAEMSAAQQTALVSGLLSGALGILLTIMIGFLMRRATMARRREEWLQKGQVGLASAIIGDQPVEQLGNSILEFLAGYLGAVAGAIFIGNGEIYRRTATYGVPDNAPVPEQFKHREGLLGQATAENRAIVVGEVPDGYLTFGSALGRDKPRHLIIVPASVDGSVNAVIELGFLQTIDDRVAGLLDRATAAVAIAVRSANYRGELQDLLEETQRQSEELQTQSEELRVSNEELEEQGRALKESQARLEQQQVSLSRRIRSSKNRLSNWRSSATIWSGSMLRSISRRGSWSRQADTNPISSPTCPTNCGRR